MAKDNWREKAKKIIETYPALLREEAEIRNCRITPTLSGMPSGGGRSRSTETTALRELRPEQQRRLDSVRNAIATTNRYRNGRDRLKIIDLVYWKRTHTLQGAALHCNYCYDTVQEWNAAFIELVDAYYRIL